MKRIKERTDPVFKCPDEISQLFGFAVLSPLAEIQHIHYLKPGGGNDKPFMVICLIMVQ